MKKSLIFLLVTLLFSCQQDQSPTVVKKDQMQDGATTVQVLLVGTFHFANFNPKNNNDVLQKKVYDVLLPEHQAELEKIANKIAEFNPDKVFVEYPFARQKKLDAIFAQFPEAPQYDTLKRNEIYQLGFRVAKQLGHQSIYAMDLRTRFPYDSLLTQMEEAQQFDLIKRDSLELETLEKSENELFNSNKSLSEILIHYNQEKYRREDVNWYLSLANQGGELDNFVGSYLTAEWYRRNLHMYATIQKRVQKNDQRIMILAGSSHIALFKDFIDYNPEWEVVELADVIRN